MAVVKNHFAALATCAAVVFVSALGSSLFAVRAQAAALLGVDVSSYQGPSINWQAVAASGRSFAYMRAAEGSSTPDIDFAGNWRHAAAAGVTPGAYLFFHPADDPTAQANLLVQQLRSVGFTQGDLLPVIDVETTDNQPAPVVIARLLTVVDTVSAAIGDLPAIYASPAWWDGHIGSSAFTVEPLWVANWGVSIPSLPANNWGGHGWAVWQYSDAGSVPGIPGSVDLDRGGATMPSYGWPVPLQLAGANAQGDPRGVSDSPGDLDVVWRGTDNRLWTVGYRNRRWGSQPVPISTAIVASDPTIVSPSAGHIDAFWAGTDGSLWQVSYVAGFFGTGTWSAPVSLGGGPMQSAPAAVSPGSGLMNVFWKGADGSLWWDRSDGAWSGSAPLRTGQVGGVPDPVVTGAGTVTVFWRDPSGVLWLDAGATWGWPTPMPVAGPSLVSDPSAVASRSGVDLFWTGTGGALWHGALSGSAWLGTNLVTTTPVVGRPAALELAPGAVMLNVRATDGSLAVGVYTTAVGMAGPERLNPGPVGSDVTSVQYADGAVAALWRVGSGVWSQAACPSCSAAQVPVDSPLS